MDLSKICSEDWHDFKQKFPEAYSFLLQRSLLNEFTILLNTLRRNAWEQERFIELLFLTKHWDLIPPEKRIKHNFP